MQQQVAAPAKKARFNGFYYGWAIVGVMALLQFATSAATFPILGLFLKPMTDEFGWSRASFSAPLTIGTIAGGFAGLVTGPAMDKYGSRWIMTFAAVLVGACFVLLGFVHGLWQHYVLLIITRSVTAGAFFMVVGVVLPKWFVAKRGRAAAFSGLGGSLGQFVMPIMVGTVILTLGWRTAWASLAILVWVAATVPVFLFLKNKPEDMGLLPDGVTPEEAARLRESTARNKQSRGRRKALEEATFSAKEVLRTRAFYMMLIAGSGLSLVISGLHLHWFAYMTSKGLSGGVAVASISISSLASVPASLVGGYLTERYQLRYILLFTYLGIGASVVLLLFTRTPVMAYTYGVALGVFSGVMGTAGLVIWADYYGRQSQGAIRGLTSPISQITNASGPLVAGLAYDATGNYTLILWIFVAISVLTSLCWLLATPPKQRVPVVESASG